MSLAELLATQSKGADNPVPSTHLVDWDSEICTWTFFFPEVASRGILVWAMLIRLKEWSCRFALPLLTH